MNKVQLIQALKDATNLTKPQAATVVDIFFNGMAGELAKGGRVEIRVGGTNRTCLFRILNSKIKQP